MIQPLEVVDPATRTPLRRNEAPQSTRFFLLPIVVVSLARRRHPPSLSWAVLVCCCSLKLGFAALFCLTLLLLELALFLGLCALLLLLLALALSLDFGVFLLVGPSRLASHGESNGVKMGGCGERTRGVGRG